MTLIAVCDESYCVLGVRHDASVDPESAGVELLDVLVNTSYSELVQRFDKTPKFKEIYGLTPPAMKSLAELLASPWHSDVAHGELEADRPEFRQLVDRQEQILDILLIPRIPEAVRTTFEMACDAYLFGVFRYNLGTISLHYSYLAIESPLKHRWISAVGRPLRIRNKRGEEQVMESPTHESIFWLKGHHGKSWDFRNLIIEGRGFPASMEDLVDDLVERTIVTPWHGKRLKHYVYFRHVLSHREFGTIMQPSAEPLRDVAWSISTLFHTA